MMTIKMLHGTRTYATSGLTKIIISLSPDLAVTVEHMLS